MTFSEVHEFIRSDRYREFLRYGEEKARLDALRRESASLFGGDLLSRFGEMSRLKEERDGHRAQLDSLAGQQASLKEQSETLAKEISDADVLLEFYKASLSELSDGYLSQLSDLLTDVYKAVYNTSAKSVQLSMEDYRGKKGIRLNIINKCGGRQYKESLSNDGGSAQIILGTMVALFYIIKVGLPRIVFFDESLSALADDTLHAFLSVLRRFSKDFGFCFVVIEHAAFRVKDFVDKIYTIEDGVYSQVGLDFDLSDRLASREAANG